MPHAFEPVVTRLVDRADEIETARRLPADLLDELHALNTFRSLIPVSVGGSELPLPEFLSIVGGLAEADASTAWCVSQGAIISTTTCWLDAPVVREIWSRPDAVVANGPPDRRNELRRDGDGWRVSGTWPFSSGCQHATLMNGTGRSDDGRFRTSFFPPSQAAFNDNWDVGGLKGTGSFEFTVKDLFVPADYVADLTQRPCDPWQLLRIPLSLTFAVSFSTLAIGLARGMLRQVMDLAQGKVPRFQTAVLRDDPDVQRMAGEAHVRLKSAALLLEQTVAEIWEAIGHQDRIADQQRIELRMAGTHGIREAAAVVDLAYAISGATAIYRDTALQRRYQDMKVITQHVQGRLSFYRVFGRFFLGFPFEPGPMD